MDNAKLWWIIAGLVLFLCSLPIPGNIGLIITAAGIIMFIYGAYFKEGKEDGNTNLK